MRPDAEDQILSATKDAGANDWTRRSSAGRRLAEWADRSDAAIVLHRLLLDQRNTAVGYDTAETLLQRNDEISVRLIAQALPEAGEQQAHWLLQAVMDYLLANRSFADFLKICHDLLRSVDPTTREGADTLIDWVRQVIDFETALKKRGKDQSQGSNKIT